MSTTAETKTTGSSSLTPQQQMQLTEQLRHLKQQQQMQQEMLIRQYQEQQDFLRQQQQRELQNHLNSQCIQYSNQKPPTSTKDVSGMGNAADDSSPSKVKPKKEEGSSSAVSNEVKQKLQEFVLNKQQREAALASASAPQDHFRRWYASTHLHSHGQPLDDDDFPLRKTASEPNLKLRSRIRQKVCKRGNTGSPVVFNKRRERTSGHSPLAKTFPGDPTPGSPSESGPVSPTYIKDKSVHKEDSREMHDAYNGLVYGYERLPLFASPSLPNIPLGAARTQLHLPPGAGSSSFGSNPNISENSRDHPYYGHLLMSQYVANQHLLAQLLVLHGKDPKDLTTLLSRFLPEEPVSESNGASAASVQQARLKILIEAQHRLLREFESAFPLAYTSGGSISSHYSSPYAKYYGGSPPGLSRFEQSTPQNKNVDGPPDSKSLRGLSMAQLQQLQQRYSDSYLLQHPSYLRSPYLQMHHELLKKHDQQMKESSLQQGKDQPARMVLKEHLLMLQKEKQGGPSDMSAHASSSGTHSSNITLKEHFMRLEKQQKEMEEEEEEERRKMYDSSSIDSEVDVKPVIHEKTSRTDSEKNHVDVERSGSFGSDEDGNEMSDVTFSSGFPRDHLKSAVFNPYTRLSSFQHSLQTGYLTKQGSGDSNRTGLIYDTIMLKHQCSCGDTGNHPEHPGRLQSIWARFQETGVAGRCERLRPRKAALTEIQTVHSEQHTLLYGGATLYRGKEGGILSLKCFSTLPCGGLGVDADTIWNETHSANAARMAVGSVIELTSRVVVGELKNGFAAVRPPGHHAEAHQAMGFCYFNSVAIAAKLLRLKMAVDRVLIVDWDIHHGNGTQQMFYDDDHVLYMSIHRHDDGMFFPGTGKPEECGAGIGMGYNVNIAFSGGLHPPYGDADYLAAFRTVLLPIAKEFDPEIIIVSAGFDAAAGHSPQLGGYRVTPQCFAHMTRQLMSVSNGRMVLCLEGGYSLPSLCDSAELCMRALLGEKLPDLPEESQHERPNSNAIKYLERVLEIQEKYWPIVKRSAPLLAKSALEAKQLEKEEADTVTALASLSMGVVHETEDEKGRMNIEEEPMEEEG